jgi:hypothetical protein
MADFYAFIAADELASGHDPVCVLRSSDTLSDLLMDKSFNPDQTAFWARAKVGPSSGQTLVVNQKTGDTLTAAVCGVDR